MKRIAYWFINTDSIIILQQFCEIDGFEPLELPPDGAPAESYLFYITDSDEHIDRELPPNTPRCLVTSASRVSYKTFLMHTDHSIKSYRLLIDRIFHGDKLWNTVQGISCGTFLKECYIDNNLTNVERFVCLMTEDVLEYCSFSEVEKIRVGFSEMITNAIEHGNLGITSKEKHNATEAGTYYNLLKERLGNRNFSKRRVLCRVGVFADRLDILIRDEGEGFDINKIPSPRDTELLMNLHGRGILIARAYFDEIKYNESGNEVTLIKRFTPNSL